MEGESRLKKIGTLGGSIRINSKMKNMYFGEVEENGAFSKEKLFGVKGPLLIGMPHKKGMALSATISDTKSDLARELQDMGLTRDEALVTIRDLLRDGTLVEIWSEDRGEKVLVLRGG